MHAVNMTRVGFNRKVTLFSLPRPGINDIMTIEYTLPPDLLLPKEARQFARWV